jgi:hypothetical protein
MDNNGSSSPSAIINDITGKSKYAVLQDHIPDNKDSRWHEGEIQEKKQHFHHLTFPNLEDIETDDAEFIDPTESKYACWGGGLSIY